MSHQGIFPDRKEAAALLAQNLVAKNLHNVLVLAIPRGGVVTGAVLAEKLGADFDVVLARKIRAPGQPELAMGAVAEGGHCIMDAAITRMMSAGHNYLEEEKNYQLSEIARRQQLFRGSERQEPVEGRTVIVTDDGVATGSTLIAALRSVRARRPGRLIAAIPVVAPASREEIQSYCDELVYVMAPEGFQSVGQYYLKFPQVTDDESVTLFKKSRNFTKMNAH